MEAPESTPSKSTARSAAQTDNSREAIKNYLVAALHGIAARLNEHPEERTDLEETSTLVQRALAQLSPEQARAEKKAISDASLHVFARILRERRAAAEMSRGKLAKRARVAPNTIRHIEEATHAPNRTTMVRLLSVPELRLQAGEDLTKEDPTFRPHSWFAPKYDPVGMMVDLIQLVNGPGGHLEQTYQYIDPQSAIHWLALSNSGPYATLNRASMPLDKAAEKIVRLAGGLGIDVNALGCGDGKHEVRLVQYLLELAKPPNVRLHLLDISHSLLSVAHRHATETLDGRGVPIVTIHGNFHDLPRYRQLYQQSDGERRCRVYTLFGRTLANLDNEIRFFDESLAGCWSGDLFLFDVEVAYAPASDPGAIRQKDPALLKGLSENHRTWLAGPVERYREDCKRGGDARVQLIMDLDTHCPVPGSYDLRARAIITLPSREERRLTLLRVRRHDPAKLAEALSQVGWEPLLTLPFGANGSKTAALMLLRKR